jgi:hypothetical protein
MTNTKRLSAQEFLLSHRVLTGLALWSMVALLCAVLASAVAAGLPQ